MEDLYRTAYRITYEKSFKDGFKALYAEQFNTLEEANISFQLVSDAKDITNWRAAMWKVVLNDGFVLRKEFICEKPMAPWMEWL
jgi:hypothetical protein